MRAADIDIRNLLSGVQAEGRIQASGRDVDVEIRVDAAVPRRVRVDGTSLRKVLDLLVGRAVACSAREAVTVAVDVAGWIPDGPAVQLRFGVHDPAQAGPATSADPFAARLKTGSCDADLELWDQLVPRVADEWGLDASPGEGTTHWFLVNAIVLPPEPAESDAMQASPAAVARVLVVEDNLVNQKVAEQLIKRMGYEVDVVGDGAQAVERMGERRYGLVLMDCQMPVMDGYQATQHIRANEADGPRTPIVALTAHAMSGNRERCLEIGMDDFVTKPVTREVLERVLGDWLPPTVPESA